jgi:hypothetical protein
MLRDVQDFEDDVLQDDGDAPLVDEADFESTEQSHDDGNGNRDRNSWEPPSYAAGLRRPRRNGQIPFDDIVRTIRTPSQLGDNVKWSLHAVFSRVCVCERDRRPASHLQVAAVDRRADVVCFAATAARKVLWWRVKTYQNYHIACLQFAYDIMAEVSDPMADVTAYKAVARKRASYYDIDRALTSYIVEGSALLAYVLASDPNFR